jgi:hypothetical protein
VPDDTRQRLFRELPSVDQLLTRPAVRKLIETRSRDVVVAETRSAVERLRREIADGERDAGSSNGSRSSLAETMEESIGASVDALT